VPCRSCKWVQQLPSDSFRLPAWEDQAGWPTAGPEEASKHGHCPGSSCWDQPLEQAEWLCHVEACSWQEQTEEAAWADSLDAAVAGRTAHAAVEDLALEELDTVAGVEPAAAAAAAGSVQSLAAG